MNVGYTSPPILLSLCSLFLWLDDCTCRSWHTQWTLRGSNSLSLCPSHFIVSSLQIVTQLYIWSMTELTITMRKGGNVNTSGFAWESQTQTSQMTIYTINRGHMEYLASLSLNDTSALITANGAIVSMTRQWQLTEQHTMTVSRGVGHTRDWSLHSELRLRIICWKYFTPSALSRQLLTPTVLNLDWLT